MPKRKVPLAANSNWKALKKSLGSHGKAVVPVRPPAAPAPAAQPASGDLTSSATNQSIVALDCEMVGVGAKDESVLAQVSIVDYDGKLIYSKYVKAQERVTNYRTFVSGVKAKDLKGGVTFARAQQEVADIIKDKIVVGHGIDNDLKALLLTHPRNKIRDTAHYPPLCRKFNGKFRPRKLSMITKEQLGRTIQTGEHDPSEDAIAALDIYKRHKKIWERILRDQQNHKKIDWAQVIEETKRSRPVQHIVSAPDVPAAGGGAGGGAPARAARATAASKQAQSSTAGGADDELSAGGGGGVQSSAAAAAHSKPRLTGRQRAVRAKSLPSASMQQGILTGAKLSTAAQRLAIGKQAGWKKQKRVEPTATGASFFGGKKQKR